MKMLSPIVVAVFVGGFAVLSSGCVVAPARPREEVRDERWCSNHPNECEHEHWCAEHPRQCDR